MNSGSAKFTAAACLALASVTLVCYWPLSGHEFINVDDPQYILQNSHVSRGLTWPGIWWAFHSFYASNWHPLTWISHMVDCSLFGVNPAGHHLTNVLLHTANTLLVFLIFLKMTGAPWRCAIVAALFAWHPMHVESVAWASERKDVLCALFFLLTLWSYCVWVERRRSAAPAAAGNREVQDGEAKPSPAAPRYYILTLFFFACGLMSKPMVVTTPFVLLLLDYWPLQRVRTSTADHRRGTIAALVLEKAPFFLMAVGDSIVTYLAQQSSGAVATSGSLRVSLRLANALVSYVRYVEHTLWPADLAAIYPYPKSWTVGAVIGAALFLGAVSLVSCLRAKRLPYLLTGWFWFLGMLVPVIGIVQVGPQALADRYMYLPAIGLFLVLTWGGSDLLAPFARSKLALAAATLAACLVCTSMELKTWRDGETLFRRALAVTKDNYVAYDYLGCALGAAGKRDEALACFNESVRLDAKDPEAQYNLGTTLLQGGDAAQAVPHLAAAAAGHPRFEPAYRNLGNAFLRLGRMEEAEEQISRAVALEPDDSDARYTLGTIELTQGRADRAEAEFAEAVRLAPENAQAHRDLGVALVTQRKIGPAVVQFAEAVRLAPGDPEMRFNLGLAFLDQNRPADAENQFVAGLRLKPDDTRFHYRLAESLERQHKVAEAIAQYREALRLTPEFPEARSELAQLLGADPQPQVDDGEKEWAH